jgi:hypothetical protein
MTDPKDERDILVHLALTENELQLVINIVFQKAQNLFASIETSKSWSAEDVKKKAIALQTICDKLRLYLPPKDTKLSAP